MKALRRLALLGIVLLETGCGLPDTYFLYSPTVVTLATGTSNNYVFANPVHDLNHDINVNFTGDELYYKFYANISDIEVNAYDPSNTSDPSVQLAAKGFFPICLGTDIPSARTDPVIAIGTGLAQAGSTVTVTIDVTNIATISTYVVTSGPSGEIRRNVPDPYLSGTTYKTFLNNTNSPSHNNYVLGSEDITNITVVTANTAYLAMYAISFGYTATSTPERSVPTYLGYVALSTFP